jgi:hypothetical protein
MNFRAIAPAHQGFEPSRDFQLDARDIEAMRAQQQSLAQDIASLQESIMLTQRVINRYRACFLFVCLM